MAPHNFDTSRLRRDDSRPAITVGINIFLTVEIVTFSFPLTDESDKLVPYAADENGSTWWPKVPAGNAKKNHDCH